MRKSKARRKTTEHGRVSGRFRFVGGGVWHGFALRLLLSMSEAMRLRASSLGRKSVDESDEARRESDQKKQIHLDEQIIRCLLSSPVVAVSVPEPNESLLEVVPSLGPQKESGSHFISLCAVDSEAPGIHLLGVKGVGDPTNCAVSCSEIFNSFCFWFESCVSCVSAAASFLQTEGGDCAVGEDTKRSEGGVIPSSASSLLYSAFRKCGKAS